MSKNERIVRYSASDLERMREHGETLTDWDRVRSMSDSQVEANADTDPDEQPGEFDWNDAVVGIPGRKAQLTVRFDRDVIDWFKSGGRGYQTRMNAVLRSYMDARRRG